MHAVLHEGLPETPLTFFREFQYLTPAEILRWHIQELLQLHEFHGGI